MSTNVRLVNSTKGLNVRSTAAGTKITTIKDGDLMYDIAGVSKVTASLDGTSYVWVKVYYYKSCASEEGEGWVTEDGTRVCSRGLPARKSVICSNDALEQYQQLVNAGYIYKRLRENSWSDNAIYAILGNMEVESTINPGKWEVENNTELGYGLTQWTPATKYFDWLPSGAAQGDIDNQIDCILYEVANKLQWDSSKHSPAMSFSFFVTSKKTCSELAEYFVRCYEQPANVDKKVAARQTNANKWSKLLGYQR